ncbi:DENN domain-containing protein 3-like [Babylonia areolata]|uniref:DENN domain-containing protein 3-like n=1 Tax=Babylonia areolata TaxID=304850 RepID=UPI003FD39E0B
MESDIKSQDTKMDGGEERLIQKTKLIPRGGGGASNDGPLLVANRFAELMLVVGIDENSGLVPQGRHGMEVDSEELLANLYDQEYEAHVLAAVSANKALYFQPYLVEDPHYPPNPSLTTPQGPSLAGQGVKGSQDSLAGGGGKRQRNGSTQSVTLSRGLSVNPAMITHHLKKIDPGKMSAGTKGANLPISEDVIQSITTFCFPDDVHVFRERPEHLIHFLVLTDVSGNKTYATCITFHKPYIIEKGSKSTLTYTLDLRRSDTQVNQVRCYFPQCCVVVSKHPYFYAMKEILSCMIGHVERDMEEMYTFVKDFTYTMTMSPAPPAGNVIVEMSVYNLSVILYPAECPEKPVNDIPLHLVFLCFHADDVLRIFSAVIMEQRIVFVSSNYALLTTIMESFLYFILPFRWRYTYVPILSASSLELLEAPGTFMMGCHTRHLDVVLQIDGLVVVNIDEGTIQVNSERSFVQRRSSVTNMIDLQAIPDIPQASASFFKKICKRVKFQLELSDVQRPFYYDIEQERMFRMKKCLQFNTEISFAFLELMVNLFRGVIPALRVDVRHFSRQAFMDSIDPNYRAFYEKVLSTDMFKMFIEDRLNERVDYWSEYEMKTRPWAHRAGGMVGGSNLPLRNIQHRRPLRKQVSISTFSSSFAQRELEVFRLPTLNEPRVYVRTAVTQLTKALEQCRDPLVKANYLYLRGVFHAAQQSTQKALDDLLSIQSAYSRLLPVQLCRELLSVLPEEDREEILRRKGVSHIQELVRTSEQLSGRRGFVVDKTTIPSNDLSLEEFVETVSLLEMVTDYDTIQRLFLALTHPDKPAFVDPYTLERVQVAYEGNEKQCFSLAIPEGFLKSEECVLRVSALIKTDFGNGRIALTDKRIFFLKDGTNACREVAKVRNISKVEKLQVHSFLNVVDALGITDKDTNVRFTAWLKEERNCWAMLVEEMRAGKLVAESTKDFTAITQAMQNVLLVDAIVRSGTDENTAHHHRLSQSADSLCYFTAYIAENRHELPKDTSQALQHRVDPNSGQRERKTVEVLLYMSGSESTQSTENSVPPRLWCGMGDGKVKVFDATNWTLEKTFVQTKGHVACLLAVGESQVWAGAQGVFIIDTATVSCNKTLTEHQDLVSDMALSTDGWFVYSASVDGSIIKWEVQTLTVMCRFTLDKECFIRSLHLHDNQLWCGTWESILVVDIEGGTHLQTFQYQPTETSASNKPEQLDCFLIVMGEIWAGCRRSGTIVVWDLDTAQLKTTHKLDCRGISAMRLIDEKIWVGTKDGTIFIYTALTGRLWKTIKAHEDAVRALCAAERRYVMSGAGSKDGKVAIWSPQTSSMETAFGSRADE